MPRPEGPAWVLGEKGWYVAPGHEERVRKTVAKALKAIDKRQRNAPRCRLCGQRCRQLDRWGLCSKVTEQHKRERWAKR